MTPPTPTPPALLPDLERQLREAAERTQPRTRTATAARRAAARPRRKLMVIALAVVLLLASAAVAAVTGVLRSGAPAPRATGLGLPYHGAGRVLPGQRGAIAVTVPDPDGGPRWGLRSYRTSRRAACWQAARVLDGRLGVLGRDGLLGDDGLFHALTPTVDRCAPLDGAGHLYVPQMDLALDNGVQDRMTCVPKGFAADPGRRDLGACPDGSSRELFYGFLGPAARAVTATAPGRRPERVALSADGSGAYLHVVKLDDPLHAPPVTLTARYADGTVRSVERRPPTYVSTRLPSPQSLRTPLHVTRRRVGKDTNYTIAFRAPVAVRRFGLDYHVVVDGPRHGEGRSCERPMRFLGYGAQDDVRRGQRVAFTLTPGIAIRYDRGWCPGAYRVRVVLQDRAHPLGGFTFRASGRR
jgi:hypothetical protein